MIPNRDSLLRRSERRAPGGRTFFVLGDAGDGASDDDMYRYTEPHTIVMETGGAWAGSKFNVPTRQVAAWEEIAW